MGPTIIVSPGPPTSGWTQRFAYDGSSNLEYIGWAKSHHQPYTLTITSVSKAAAAVVTSTAHGLTSGMLVTIAGATGDWAGVNGEHIVTVTGANTFTIPINTSAYTGDFAGTVTATGPRTNQAIWALQKIYYSGTSQERIAWANGSPAPACAWDSRTTYGYE